jgi:ABC-2 type transport system ATP-binding protein
MIHVSSLTKKYGDFSAVTDVSFDIPTGVIAGLLGPNGAGKTTIMKALTGFHFPSSGTISIDERDIEEAPQFIKSMIGYLPEGTPLYQDMTVAEYLDFIADARSLFSDRNEIIAKTMKRCGLEGTSNIPIEHLSKGYRQRVGLAQAILHDPAILILDEPTTGLDPNQILEIRNLIRELGKDKTVILSTHILQDVEALCSRIIILNEGKIVADGTPNDIAKTIRGEEYIICNVKNAEARRFVEAFCEYVKNEAEILSPGHFRVKLLVPSDKSDEISEAVFKWAVEHKAFLAELVREKMSIEDIFVRFTKE